MSSLNASPAARSARIERKALQDTADLLEAAWKERDELSRLLVFEWATHHKGAGPGPCKSAKALAESVVPTK